MNYVTRHELQSLLMIHRSKTYELQKQGVLPDPINGFGKTKLFDLKECMARIHRHFGWPPLTDDQIDNQWRAILSNRLQS